MPREFLDEPSDRYLLEEEGDATEMYFIMHGQWCVAFNSFSTDVRFLENDEDPLFGTPDM
jgi:hypothetical protein